LKKKNNVLDNEFGRGQTRECFGFLKVRFLGEKNFVGIIIK